MRATPVACALGLGAEGKIGAVAAYLAAVAPCPDVVGAGIEKNSEKNRLKQLVITRYDEYHSRVVEELMDDQSTTSRHSAVTQHNDVAGNNE